MWVDSQWTPKKIKTIQCVCTSSKTTWIQLLKKVTFFLKVAPLRFLCLAAFSTSFTLLNGSHQLFNPLPNEISTLINTSSLIFDFMTAPPPFHLQSIRVELLQQIVDYNTHFCEI